MTVKELKDLLYDCEVEIDDENYNMLERNVYSSKKLNKYDEYEIIDISTLGNEILIRIVK